MDETRPKSFVHETVGDGVAASAGVSQKVAEAYGFVTDRLVNELGPEESESVDHVQRSPTYEKFQDDDEKHFYHSPLVGETFLVIRLSQTCKYERFKTRSEEEEEEEGLTYFSIGVDRPNFGGRFRDFGEILGEFRTEIVRSKIRFSRFGIQFLFFPRHFSFQAIDHSQVFLGRREFARIRAVFSVSRPGFSWKNRKKSFV